MNLRLHFFNNFFIFFIFVYYFNKLKKESQRSIQTVFYDASSKNLSVLLCVSLKYNCEKKNFLTNNFKKTKYKNETMKDLICHLNKNIPLNPKLIIEEAEKWNFMDAFESKLNNTIKKEIILFDYHLCANYDLIVNMFKQKKYFKFDINNINVKIFLFLAGNLNSLLGASLFTFNFDKEDKFISKLSIKEIDMSSLNNKKLCFNKNLEYNSTKGCSIINCYKQCSKKKIDSYKFLYTKNDNLILKIDNKKNNPIDINCYKKCLKNFHGIYYYLNELKYEIKKPKNIQLIFDKKVKKIVSKQLITNKMFILKITGLLSVLLGFNYLNFLLKFLSELNKILKIKKYVLVKKIEVLIFLFILANLLIDCYSLVQTYNNFTYINISTVLFPIKKSSFSISPCFDVKTILEKRKTYSILEKKKLSRKNIFYLETYTLKLDDIINKSSIQFITNNKKVNFFKKKKNPTFYLSEWDFKKTKQIIYKCFLVNMNIKQSFLSNLLGGVFFNFKFNVPISFYYLTDKNHYPNSNSVKFYYKSRYMVLKNNLNGDKTSFKCKNYEKYCSTQNECIDNCYVLKYFAEFKKLPLNTPILMKWYKKKQYKSLFFHLLYKPRKHQYKKTCFKSFPLIDCYKKSFKAISESYNLHKYNITKKISVFSHSFTKSNSRVIFMDKQELVSNILTSFSVWIGFSIPKLTKSFFVELNKKIFYLFNKRLIFSSKINKIFKIWFNIMLFIGFLYNLQLLKTETLKQSKVISVNYRFLSEIEFPFITICLNFKKKLNLSKYSNLSGNLLDQITFSANDVFESVKYLNGSFKMQMQTNLKRLEFSKNNSVLQLSHFYFMGLKCYKFKYKVKIPFYRFYRKKKDSSFITINLRPNITRYYITLGTSRSLNFNHFTTLFKQKNNIFFFKKSIKSKDSYYFLKDVTYFFKKKIVNLNEAKSFSNYLKKKLQKTKNFATLMLPLDEKYFNLTINDDVFYQFYKNEIIKLEQQNTDENYSVVYFLRTFLSLRNTSENKVKIRPFLIEVITTISDKLPVEYFLLVVLNVISFWFNFSLINIVEKIDFFVKAIIQFLIFLKILLWRLTISI